MKIIRHRRNTLAELQATPTELGVEVDIRSQGTELVIHHDPFVAGEPFEAWIAAYRHGTLILNVKEEGLETRLLALMERHGITDFFFLDQSFPFLVKTANQGERRCAVRVSEFESVDTALTLAGRIEWVWVDCFTRFPLDAVQAARLQDAGLKLCLVSPELQGRGTAGIADMRRLLEREGIVAEAVCTKEPEAWR
ncbi:hypothetical protein FW320_02525 [Azospirillum sp. Vi22]|uniref:phosphatidylinositol-specific phospholipase C/glycerophosphodiester phosphodiesterase family protein n=1 Tax=Azospirillum baldaniorum TaxID=1064539 RepID=UPI00157A87E6|nr:phosphatidylinositol-specific phospholipase C/glycerophosphodiester phosphodiesterase family protein [Azospirillum baldaniorum]NUB05069.1 hypothetical protein [Azospirillum baldaniorum]